MAFFMEPMLLNPLFVTLQKGGLSPPTKELKRTVAKSKCLPTGSIKSACSHHEEGMHAAQLGNKLCSYCVLCVISSRENHLSFALKKTPCEPLLKDHCSFPQP